MKICLSEVSASGNVQKTVRSAPLFLVDLRAVEIIMKILQSRCSPENALKSRIYRIAF